MSAEHLKVEIVLSERAMAAAALRAGGGPLHGPKPIEQTPTRSRYVVTFSRAEQVAAALENCYAHNKSEALFGRDPDLETDTYAVRIAATMLRRALAQPRPRDGS